MAPRIADCPLMDAATGVEVEPVMVDRHTARRVDTGDFVFTAGPAASNAMRTRYTPATPILAAATAE